MTRGLQRLSYRFPATTLVVLATVLWSALAATGPSLLASDAAPLDTCQDSIRTAALKLDSETRRAVSACLSGGVECLVGPTEARDGCCQQVAARCRAGLGRIDEAQRQFGMATQNGRCEDASFADVVSPSGLGYGSLGDVCGALVPPASVADLAALTSCLARLIVGHGVCELGTHELPRGADALACMGLEEEFGAATGVDLRTCNLGAPPPSCDDGKRTIVVSLDAPYAAAVVDLTYPGAVNLPGSGDVGDVVHFDAENFVTTVNDHDQSGDAVDETLTMGLVNFAINPPGPFATVTFECSGATAPPLGLFACTVGSASDDAGTDITSQVGCVVGIP
jgi:hypothetical protein